MQCGVHYLRAGGGESDANIVHVVKKCYKIKIDYRDFRGCFYRVLQLLSSSASSNGLHLHSNRTTFARQKDYSCTPIVVPLKGKCSPFAMKRTFFAFAFFAGFACYAHNVLSVNGISETVQNSRISSQRFPRALSSQF